MRKFAACAVTLLALTLAVSGASAVTQTEAETLAMQAVGETAQVHRVEWDDGLYEISLSEGGSRYQVDVRESDGAVIEIEMATTMATRARSYEITENQAADAVLAVHPDASIDLVLAERDDGSCVYEVYYSMQDEIGSATINAITGEIIGTKRWPEAAKLGVITAGEAIAKTNDRAQGEPGELELSYDRWGYVYEGEIYLGRTECSFEIDALTGDILEWEWDD